MKAQKGQALYAEESSPSRGDVMADPREQFAPLPRTTSAGPYKQLLSMDAGSSGQPGPHPSRWRGQWLATTLALMAIPLLIGGIGLFLFTGVDQELMISLLLVGGIGLLLVAGVYFASSRIHVEKRHFSVSPYPQVVVYNDRGTIHVTAGSTSNEVTIQATRWSRRLVKASRATHVCYEQSDDGNTVTARVKQLVISNIKDTDRVDFDITVPSHTDLRLFTKVGDIWVTGISGQMLLVGGHGTITVKAGMLSGNSLLTTSTSAINFSEPISPQGTYSFVTATGPITVILPSDASFHLDASTDTGTITTDFPGVIITHRRKGTIHSNAGYLPRAKVALRSRSGSIQLYAGSDDHFPA